MGVDKEEEETEEEWQDEVEGRCKVLKQGLSTRRQEK